MITRLKNPGSERTTVHRLLTMPAKDVDAVIPVRRMILYWTFAKVERYVVEQLNYDWEEREEILVSTLLLLYIILTEIISSCK